MRGSLKGERDILFFAGIDWDGGNKMPCHHVVERLAKRHRVFYIDNFGGIRDLTCSDCSRAFRKLRGVISHKAHQGGVSENDVGRPEGSDPGETLHPSPHGPRPAPVTVDRPLILPTPRTRILQVLNGWLLNCRMQKLIEHHRIDKPIIWTRLPIELVWRAISGVDRSLLIYQMIDKFPEHPKIAPSLRARHGRWEHYFSEHADLVFASARGLWEEKRAINPESYFFPNGVSGIFRKTGIPKEPVERRSPIIGFSGAVGTSLDLEWVAEMARMRPEFEFVLLGAIDPEVDVAALKRLPNVRLVGRVAHASLPEWFSGFDAAFMAYRINEYQRYTFPSKMAEYLLAGLPVVSNRLPEVEPYNAVVRTVDSPREMVHALDQAVAERGDEALLSKRRRVGESLSWDRIVEEMEAVIEARMEKAERVDDRRC